MSVQRWTLWDFGAAQTSRDDGGAWVKYADHARIVAEMEVGIAALLLAREQAHAAALAEELQTHLDALAIVRGEVAATSSNVGGPVLSGMTVMLDAPRTYVCNNPDHRACTGCDLAAAPRTLTADDICIVFDGPPEHVAGRFVEVEDRSGVSINAGTWEQSEDGYWRLWITRPVPRTLAADDPEPSVGSVVMDGMGQAWQRSGWNDGPWFPTDSMVGCEWSELARVPVTLIHGGGAA